MEKPAPILIQLISEIEIPDPNDPNDPNSPTVFTPAQLSSLSVVIALLVNYIQVQLERCGDAG